MPWTANHEVTSERRMQAAVEGEIMIEVAENIEWLP